MRNVVLLAGILFAGCAEMRPGLNQYDLAYEETVNIDSHLRVKFAAILYDGRCPADTDQCLTEDFATLEFRATNEPSDTFFFSLVFSDRREIQTDTVIFGEYNLRINRLSPERFVGDNPLPEDYTARLGVEKLK